MLTLAARFLIVAVFCTLPHCASNEGAVSIGVGSGVARSGSRPQFTIVAIAGRNGSVHPSGSVSVNLHDDATFRFTPAHSYFVDSVVIDGRYHVGASSEYTFTLVSSDHTIEVFFGGPRAYFR